MNWFPIFIIQFGIIQCAHSWFHVLRQIKKFGGKKYSCNCSKINKNDDWETKAKVLFAKELISTEASTDTEFFTWDTEYADNDNVISVKALTSSYCPSSTQDIMNEKEKCATCNSKLADEEHWSSPIYWSHTINTDESSIAITESSIAITESAQILSNITTEEMRIFRPKWTWHGTKIYIPESTNGTTEYLLNSDKLNYTTEIIETHTSNRTGEQQLQNLIVNSSSNKTSEDTPDLKITTVASDFNTYSIKNSKLSNISERLIDQISLKQKQTTNEIVNDKINRTKTKILQKLKNNPTLIVKLVNTSKILNHAISTILTGKETGESNLKKNITTERDFDKQSVIKDMFVNLTSDNQIPIDHIDKKSFDEWSVQPIQSPIPIRIEYAVISDITYNHTAHLGQPNMNKSASQSEKVQKISVFPYGSEKSTTEVKNQRPDKLSSNQTKLEATTETHLPPEQIITSVEQLTTGKFNESNNKVNDKSALYTPSSSQPSFTKEFEVINNKSSNEQIINKAKTNEIYFSPSMNHRLTPNPNIQTFSPLSKTILKDSLEKLTNATSTSNIENKHKNGKNHKDITLNISEPKTLLSNNNTDSKEMQTKAKLLNKLQEKKNKFEHKSYLTKFRKKFKPNSYLIKFNKTFKNMNAENQPPTDLSSNNSNQDKSSLSIMDPKEKLDLITYSQQKSASDFTPNQLNKTSPKLKSESYMNSTITHEKVLEKINERNVIRKNETENYSTVKNKMISKKLQDEDESNYMNDITTSSDHHNIKSKLSKQLPNSTYVTARKSNMKIQGQDNLEKLLQYKNKNDKCENKTTKQIELKSGTQINNKVEKDAIQDKNQKMKSLKKELTNHTSTESSLKVKIGNNSIKFDNYIGLSNLTQFSNDNKGNKRPNTVFYHFKKSKNTKRKKNKALAEKRGHLQKEFQNHKCSKRQINAIDNKIRNLNTTLSYKNKTKNTNLNNKNVNLEIKNKVNDGFVNKRKEDIDNNSSAINQKYSESNLDNKHNKNVTIFTSTMNDSESESLELNKLKELQEKIQNELSNINLEQLPNCEDRKKHFNIFQPSNTTFTSGLTPRKTTKITEPFDNFNLFQNNAQKETKANTSLIDHIKKENATEKLKNPQENLVVSNQNKVSQYFNKIWKKCLRIKNRRRKRKCNILNKEFYNTNPLEENSKGINLDSVKKINKNQELNKLVTELNNPIELVNNTNNYLLNNTNQKISDNNFNNEKINNLNKKKLETNNDLSLTNQLKQENLITFYNQSGINPTKTDKYFPTMNKLTSFVLNNLYKTENKLNDNILQNNLNKNYNSNHKQLINLNNHFDNENLNNSHLINNEISISNCSSNFLEENTIPKFTGDQNFFDTSIGNKYLQSYFSRNEEVRDTYTNKELDSDIKYKIKNNFSINKNHQSANFSNNCLANRQLQNLKNNSLDSDKISILKEFDVKIRPLEDQYSSFNGKRWLNDQNDVQIEETFDIKEPTKNIKIENNSIKNKAVSKIINKKPYNLQNSNSQSPLQINKKKNFLNQKNNLNSKYHPSTTDLLTKRRSFYSQKPRKFQNLNYMKTISEIKKSALLSEESKYNSGFNDLQYNLALDIDNDKNKIDNSVKYKNNKENTKLCNVMIKHLPDDLIINDNIIETIKKQLLPRNFKNQDTNLNVLTNQLQKKITPDNTIPLNRLIENSKYNLDKTILNSLAYFNRSNLKSPPVLLDDNHQSNLKDNMNPIEEQVKMLMSMGLVNNQNALISLNPNKKILNTDSQIMPKPNNNIANLSNKLSKLKLHFGLPKETNQKVKYSDREDEILTITTNSIIKHKKKAKIPPINITIALKNLFNRIKPSSVTISNSSYLDKNGIFQFNIQLKQKQ